MPRLQTLILLATFSAACSSSAPKAAPAPAEHALAGLAAERVAVLPTYLARVVAPLDWSIGRAADVQRTLDADIAAAFDERGLKRGWVFPDQIVESNKRNASYATDPYHFAEEPLRSSMLAVDTRLPEPLASQVRTLVALHQDVRLVLMPVELRLEPAAPRGGRAVLRVVVVDARLSNVRWVGDVTSDRFESFGPGLSASVADRLAGIVSPR